MKDQSIVAVLRDGAEFLLRDLIKNFADRGDTRNARSKSLHACVVGGP